MALHQLKGNFKGFYQAGASSCVRDSFRFRAVGEGRLLLAVTRRDQTSARRRFWRHETSTFHLAPVDVENPALGGQVRVLTRGFNFQTF